LPFPPIPKETQERKSLAASLKQKGNVAYQVRKFDVAAQYYTRAIAVSPQPEPVFYSNRAACYVSMEPPQHENAVADCDEALKLDSRYVKALNRRATALEALERYEEALRGASVWSQDQKRKTLKIDFYSDYTATTILGKFQNDASGRSVERVLEKLSKKKAAEILAVSSFTANRGPSRLLTYLTDSRAPSPFPHIRFGLFLGLPTTYVFPLIPFSFPVSFNSTTGPLPTLPESPSVGDNTLIIALEALAASDYAHSFSLVNESLEQGITWDLGRAEALNLRGTFKSAFSITLIVPGPMTVVGS
jgi:import receptor subunit TOM70